jgi:hypothetical protein
VRRASGFPGGMWQMVRRPFPDLPWASAPDGISQRARAAIAIATTGLVTLQGGGHPTCAEGGRNHPTPDPERPAGHVRVPASHGRGRAWLPEPPARALGREHHRSPLRPVGRWRRLPEPRSRWVRTRCPRTCWPASPRIPHKVPTPLPKLEAAKAPEPLDFVTSSPPLWHPGHDSTGVEDARSEGVVAARGVEDKGAEQICSRKGPRE